MVNQGNNFVIFEEFFESEGNKNAINYKLFKINFVLTGNFLFTLGSTEKGSNNENR